jgi:hypothetical protein
VGIIKKNAACMSQGQVFDIFAFCITYKVGLQTTQGLSSN